MKLLNILRSVSLAILKPFRDNAAFLVFMYVLGLVCVYAVVPAKPGYAAWELAPYEVFFDAALLCVLLWLVPRRVGVWLKRLFYVVAYLLAFVEVCCFMKFETAITPTMLLLVGETNSNEASEFLSSYLSADMLLGRPGRVLLVLAVHVAWAVVWNSRGWLERRLSPLLSKARVPAVVGAVAESCLGLALGVAVVVSVVKTIDNKIAFGRLMTYDNIGEVEHELTRKDKAVLNQPVYRLVFSVYANHLVSRQLTKLVDNIDKVKVDSCSFRSKNIVLIIGESYNRHHAGLYGYSKDTTPRQSERARKGELTPFGDVVAPWNLTSYVFKDLFSAYTVGDEGEWCDYPLFPEVFRKAGYHVTFLTNQFLPRAREAVYDFSGGFFLNNPRLSESMFDTRNSKLYRLDAGLLAEYDRLKSENKEHNLIIFHLMGQHVGYYYRFPRGRRHFNPQDYDRPELNEKELRVLADYDNAVLYNDSIVDGIIKRFEDEDAIVLYVPDHGEECYEGNVHFYGRMHSTEITARLAREEFDIPFWIWCSSKYRKAHPDIVESIKGAKDKRYMTDAVPHLLFYLGGISSPHYRESLNLIGDKYDEDRPRTLKNTTDYDKLGVKK